jgi:hypothetical protein
MTNSSVGAIATAFQDEGFAPNPDSRYEDSSSRRSTAQAYLESVDWTDRTHVARALRAFERLLLGLRPDNGSSYLDWDQFVRAMKRDKYEVDADGQIISLTPAPRLAEGALAGLTDAAAIREQLDRIGRSVNDDPALAVGSAKELIESTAKVVLAERGESVRRRSRSIAALRSASRRRCDRPVDGRVPSAYDRPTA